MKNNFWKTVKKVKCICKEKGCTGRAGIDCFCFQHYISKKEWEKDIISLYEKKCFIFKK